MTDPDLSAQSKPQPIAFLVVDDHEVVLNGTIDLLRRKYPEAEIFTAKTVRDTLEQVQKVRPNLVVLDLAIPESCEQTTDPTSETGIQLLRCLMQTDPDLNIMVQSSHVKTLIRIKQEIDLHRGGFAIVDKSLSGREMLARVEGALQGFTHTRDLQTTRVELKPEWLKVLVLAFQEGLQDQAIAQRMQVSYRTVRHYWTKLYDALGIYSENGKNPRIQTEKRAREIGLID